MPKRKPQNDDMRLFSFQVSDASIERFREIAKAEHRSVSQELRRLIEQRIMDTTEPEEMAA